MEFSIKLKSDQVLKGFISKPPGKVCANIILIHGLSDGTRGYIKEMFL